MPTRFRPSNLPARVLTRGGFALPEVLSLLLIIATTIALLVLASHDSRRRSRQGCSIDNLRFFASGTQSYAADNAGRFWSYSWTAGPQNTEYPDLNFAADNLTATTHEAIYLIRQFGETPQFGIAGWAPQFTSNHLPLLRHLGLPMISRQAVSPEDSQQLNWQRGEAAFLQSSPRPEGSVSSILRFMYSSSYESGPAFWSPDAAAAVNGMVQPTVNQGPWHYSFIVPPSMTFGQRRLDEVRFPSSKAHMWDRYQRDLGSRMPYFSVSEARIPVLCVDGSSGLRAAANTNHGFRPSTPMNPSPTTFAYQPDAWEPPTTTGDPSQILTGRQRWTRWGLRGRDFNGPEVTAP